MIQSDIIAGIYNSVSKNALSIVTEKVTVKVIVIDVCQIMSDKSGQKIIVDEKQYEQPAIYEICFSILISGKDIPSVLKAYGQIAVFFKDNSAIDIAEWKWHGCNSDKIYLEPVIRKTDCRKNSFDDEVQTVELLYKTECSLNSQKAYNFKRVEKRDIRGYVKK